MLRIRIEIYPWRKCAILNFFLRLSIILSCEKNTDQNWYWFACAEIRAEHEWAELFWLETALISQYFNSANLPTQSFFVYSVFLSQSESLLLQCNAIIQVKIFEFRNQTKLNLIFIFNRKLRKIVKRFLPTTLSRQKAPIQTQLVLLVSTKLKKFSILPGWGKYVWNFISQNNKLHISQFKGQKKVSEGCFHKSFPAI